MPSWVLVAPGFHAQGGMERANAALARYLLTRGDTVHLVAPRIEEDLSEHPRAIVHRVPAVRMPLLADPALDLCGRRVARAAARQCPGTRVLVNGGNCDWGDINWVHFVHHAWRGGQEAPFWFRMKDAAVRAQNRRRERRIVRRARLVIANSLLSRRQLIERLGIDPAVVEAVYLGTEPGWGPPSVSERRAARARFGHPGERPLVVFVGGIGRDGRKGFDTLWSAWRTLCARPEWDADLLAAGGGADDAWRRRTAAAGLDRRIRILGFTARVESLLAAADLLVSPARYEPYGLNVQEAICRGVPAMAPRCAGIAERYPAELAGLLLPDPGDAAALADRLLAWRGRIDEWKARFAPLGRRLRAYTWEHMAGRIAALAEAGAAPLPAKEAVHP